MACGINVAPMMPTARKAPFAPDTDGSSPEAAAPASKVPRAVR